jgi:hypothetical protein
LSCDFAFTWNLLAWQLELSISALRQSDDWRIKAADSGLLSPELAAGIRRVNGAKQLGPAQETG